MKNTHITTLKKEVPIKLRLEIYKEVLNTLNDPSLDKVSGIGESKYLCLLLPCILWNIWYMAKIPNTHEEWDLDDTSLAFPELTTKIIKVLNNIDNHEKPSFTNNKRKEYITKWIENLTNQLNSK